MLEQQTTARVLGSKIILEIGLPPVMRATPAFPLPDNEIQRLRALAAYGLADTAPEVDFNHFAAMIADLLDLPVGLVNLVGEEHLTVKGRFGLEVDSIPRSVAFCSHTIMSAGALVIPDLSRDPRFADNPLAQGTNAFRFYAGAPLVSPRDGQRIGTICVAGYLPRSVLSEREARLLSGFAALVMDRMELRRAEKARHDAQAQFERMNDAAPGAVICAGSDHRISHWNAAAERLFGWPVGEAVGQLLDIIVPTHMRAAHHAGMQRLISSGNRAYPGRVVDLPSMRRDGTIFPAQVSLSCWYVDDAPMFCATIHDISARQVAEERLRYLAHYDPLTGLVNRARLNELISEASRANGVLALVLLDLNGFKLVNDTLGHAAGDVLLVEVAERLRGALQGQGTLARLGGDEFAALLTGCSEAGQACDVARMLQYSLAPMFHVAGREFRLSAGAGVAVVESAKVETLLTSADLALYKSKNSINRQVRLFNDKMREEYIQSKALEEEVRRAALRGEFELYYQPQVCLVRNALVGVEALLRWRHPERGMLSPAVFLDALEAGPMAGIVGDWVVEEACRQAATWQTQGLKLRVGVNLFAEQLRGGNLEESVKSALARWRLPPETLELEITETIVLRNNDSLLAPLHTLHAFGVGIAFDDFGTGFASLSTLKHCPLSRLKIDQSFVSGLGTRGIVGSGEDRGNVAIIEAVLALGRGLGLGVVVEGVETEAQVTFLRAKGCGEAQGYFYGRPAPASLMLAALPSGFLNL